ncbi:MAG: formate dehydrogenase accessory sulfurtransferase FdhD [Proteobacteria bacterium]|nr:formate dehydrogenase accessory sulfurtransferase FdhD [Pseudomonadota bacterium]
MTSTNVEQREIRRFEAGSYTTRCDSLSVEEPLEIVLDHFADSAWQRSSIAVSMRTPGHDFEMAIGFLISEGVIADANSISQYEERLETSRQRIILRLDENLRLDLQSLTRHVYTSSSCGICGKASIEQVRRACSTKPRLTEPIDSRLLLSLPAKLREAQQQFTKTGGLHASGLFNIKGELIVIREDIGRHNALDKIVGYASKTGRLALTDHILLLSGRASFELIQKAAIAGIPVVAAIGAPSNLAIDLAKCQVNSHDSSTKFSFRMIRFI